VANKIKKALVVDDEESLREIISEVLEMLDIKSIMAEDGPQAIELVEQHKDDIDVFLIDRFMPQMSGEETYVKLHEFLPECPVIFMSGYEQQENNLPIKTSAEQKFLKKPFGISQLKDVVTSLL
jgi:CheY-like chemotaxis protein